jgi:hypothetical protein
MTDVTAGGENVQQFLFQNAAPAEVAIYKALSRLTTSPTPAAAIIHPVGRGAAPIVRTTIVGASRTGRFPLVSGQRQSPPSAGCLLVLAAVLLGGGCNRNENLADVTGVITLDGKPLEDALVVFSPRQGGTTSYGRTGADGAYRLYFNDHTPGGWLGENVVRISTGDVDATGEGGKPERVPVQYNQRSTLTALVKAGRNTFDFELDSGAGRIIQPPRE